MEDITKNFMKEKQKLWDYLDGHKIWVVATGNQADITASSMCILSRKEHIYFQTDLRFEKFRNISENNHIALCCGNYRIKGIAQILGSTTSEKNTDIMEDYQFSHPDSYRRYSKKKEAVLIEVIPVDVKVWEYIDGKPYISILDLVNQTYEQKQYE